MTYSTNLLVVLFLFPFPDSRQLKLLILDVRIFSNLPEFDLLQSISLLAEFVQTLSVNSKFFHWLTFKVSKQQLNNKETY